MFKNRNTTNNNLAHIFTFMHVNLNYRIAHQTYSLDIDEKDIEVFKKYELEKFGHSILNLLY